MRETEVTAPSKGKDSGKKCHLAYGTLESDDIAPSETTLTIALDVSKLSSKSRFY